MKELDYKTFEGLFKGLDSQQNNMFAHSQVRENEAKYQLVFQNAPIGLIHFDKNGVITSCNDTFVRIMGSSHEALIGMEIAKLPDKRVVKLLKSALNGKYGHLEGIYTSVSGGKPIYGKLNFQPIINDEGQVMGGVGILEDITERKEYQQRLEYLSKSDPITGLFNRTYFEQYLDSVNTGLFKEKMAIIVCDIDDLKLVNDTMGHSAGDRLLVAAGKLLKDSTPIDSVAARIGGDEFAILIPVHSPDTIEDFEQKLEKNITLHNEKHPDLPVSISYGYAVSDENQNDMKALFRKADLLMYRDKNQHRRLSRNSKIQRFLHYRQPAASCSPARTATLKAHITAFCEFLNISQVVIHYILGLADYHDIGKAGLEKCQISGQFTEEEAMLEMQKHCEIGYRIALSSDEISIFANAILKHHEFWNGKGYPLGIKGQEIPLECRIFSIVCAYDELIINGLSRAEAFKKLQDMAGRELDPEFIRMFILFMEQKDSDT